MTNNDLDKRLSKLENRLEPPEPIRIRIVWSCGDFVEIDGVRMTREEYIKQLDPNTIVIKPDWD